MVYGGYEQLTIELTGLPEITEELIMAKNWGGAKPRKESADAGKSAVERLVIFYDGLNINWVLGWLFLGFGFAEFGNSLTNSILWCVLAKLCWMHSDMKER